MDSLLKCSLLLAAMSGLPAISPRTTVAQANIESSSSTAGVVSVHPAEGPPEPSHKPQGTNTLAYWFGSRYHTPFVLEPNTFQAADITRNTLEFTHVDFWKLGSNFADLMVNQSDMAEPAASGGSGATEVYVTLRSEIGLKEATHSSTFRIGPLRDVGIEAGTNLETKNSSFAPAERTLYLGPKLQLSLSRGLFNVGLHYRAGLWYWHNEYGKPSSIPGAKQATPFVGLVYHLDGGKALQTR